MTWILLLALGCGADKDVDEDDDDTASTEGTAAPAVLSGRASCPDEFTYEIRLQSNFSVSDAMLNTFEVVPDARGWDEQHPLVAPPLEGADGDEVVWTLEADRTYDPGYATVFQCGVHDTSAAMVYVARVYDDESNYVDCVAWGGDVAAVLAAPRGGGDVTSFNVVSLAEQITPELCSIL
ncbi:MAG: hypothetical protein ACI8PZ_003089 [Myxococcota bacterium]